MGRVRLVLTLATGISLAAVSVGMAQEQTTVRQNVYSGVPNYPSYPQGYPQYPSYPAYPPYAAPMYPGYPPPGYPGGYPGYPGGAPGGYPGYDQGPTALGPGAVGQSVVRDPSTGEMITAGQGADKRIEVDPAVRLRGQTPTWRGPQPSPGSGLGGQGPARDELVGRTGRTAGIRDGYAQESERINAAILKQADWLDRTYPFPQLMVSQYVVPPVVILTGDRVEQNGPKVLDLTLGRFEIYSQARLTAQPPSWRNYLHMQSDPSNGITLRPRTERDQKEWDKAYQAGVAVGVKEARAYFEEAERRMRRDFEGMVRFHDLAQRGAISLPQTIMNGKALYVGKGGQLALRGLKRIQITVSPRFKAGAGAEAFPVGSADVTVRGRTPVPSKVK